MQGHFSVNFPDLKTSGLYELSFHVGILLSGLILGE